jgi:hypothetical protein
MEVNIMSEEVKKPSLSEMLSSIAQLIMQGTYPATHARLIVEAISVLEKLAESEAKDEEPALAIVEEPVSE